MALKNPDETWTRNDADTSIQFGIQCVFSPNSADPLYENTLQTETFLKEDHQMDVPLKITSISEITAVINSLKRKKSPGYDLITTNILLQLPPRVMNFLCIFIMHASHDACFQITGK